MVELMNVREQVDPDYARAHRRALVGGFVVPTESYKEGECYRSSKIRRSPARVCEPNTLSMALGGIAGYSRLERHGT